jgi:hypothetical protein
MGLAEWGVQNSGLVQREMRLSGATDARTSSLFAWTAMSVDAAWLENVLATACGVSGSTIRGVLNVFSLGGYAQSTGSASNAGDGFFPPLARFGSQVMFSPLIMLTTLTDRNVAFALNGLDRDRFDREVSENLEPKLIADMSAVLRADPAAEVVTDVRWSSGGQDGEIDAVVVRPGRPGVLLVQAKGAIPPAGSRSTRHVETRVQEGLRQSRRFAALPTSERDRILRGALDRPVSGEPLVGAVLVRTNVGTARVWREAGDVLLLTLPLLRAVVKSQIRREGAFIPGAIPETARAELNELQRRVAPIVRHDFADLHWVGFDLPIIDLDERELLRIASAWA